MPEYYAIICTIVGGVISGLVSYMTTQQHFNRQQQQQINQRKYEAIVKCYSNFLKLTGKGLGAQLARDCRRKNGERIIPLAFTEQDKIRDFNNGLIELSIYASDPIYQKAQELREQLDNILIVDDDSTIQEVVEKIQTEKLVNVSRIVTEIESLIRVEIRELLK